VQENKFPELTAEKEKLIIKSILTKNTAEVIKPKRSCTRIDEI